MEEEKKEKEKKTELKWAANKKSPRFQLTWQLRPVKLPTSYVFPSSTNVFFIFIFPHEDLLLIEFCLGATHSHKSIGHDHITGMATSTEGSLVQLRDGARLYVKILGDNDKSKQLVVVLHGGPGVADHREPEASFGFLSSRFRVLVYDARGSGRSDLKGPYTHDRWAADIDELRYGIVTGP